MQLAGKRVLVLGLGLSGTSAALFCAARGARVVAADERDESALGDLAALRREPGVEDVITGAPFPDPAGFDVTVPSPGIPGERYRDAARIVWGDIELAARALEVPIVAVTGTNGKSTTVMLIEAMLRAGGRRAMAAGNVGTPALSLVGQALDVAVLEVSSFQLETTDAFRPSVAVVLNVTPDHLDRHGDLTSYAEAKRRILRAQRADDVAVLGWDDAIVRGFADGARAEVVPFSTRSAIVDGGHRRAAWLDTGSVVLRDGETSTRVPLDALPLAGRHNLENTVAALTAAWVSGVDPVAAVGALLDFRGLPHRCEVIGEARGMTWIDDSKATNPGAAARALEGMGGRVIWIAGGRGKGLPYDELVDAASGRVKRALLIGEAAGELEEALGGRVPCERVGDLDEAVRRAAVGGSDGDVVLLAPACASFDQFESFEARGEHFRAAVERLAREGDA